MDYMSAKEAAVKWGISQRRVAILCSENRVLDATMVGNMWIIPFDAEKPIDARSTRYEPEQDGNIKPFLKWAGGKGQLLAEIRKLYPAVDGHIKKYAEPFVGGGAVLFDILNNYIVEEAYISDINKDLINAYRVVRDSVEDLIDILVEYQTEYVPKETEDRKVYYLNKRERYNSISVENESENIEKAALMIFLNKTCFNGLYRVNKKGQYNVPMGAYKNPLICDSKNLRGISDKLKSVNIVCGDYRESESFIDRDTFVYFDPPYRPLNITSSFTAYTENEFNDREQKELAEYVDKISKTGASVVVSNSDPKNVDEKDDFFDDIYSKHKIRRVEATRMINSKSESRGKIKELLISNF